jgi:hypothetical protein
MYASATEASIMALFLLFRVRALEFSQLGSTNGTALAHPYVRRMELKVHNHMLHWQEESRWNDFLQLT